MSLSDCSLFDRLVLHLREKFLEYRAPLLAALIAAFASQGYSLFNKMIQMDDLSAFYSKGAALPAGRWMLEGILALVLPDYSMPWINGLLGFVFLAMAACCVLAACGIKNHVSQALLAALFTSFPTVTSLYTMPFMSAVNALAILLSSAAALLFLSPRRRDAWIGVGLTVISLGIYQSYITLTAVVFILVMLRRLLFTQDTPKAVFLSGVRCVALLVVSVAVYGGITLLWYRLSDAEMMSYAVSSTGLATRVRVVFTAFIGIFSRGYHSIVNSRASLVAHLVCAAVCIAAFLLPLRRRGEKGRTVLSLLCLVLVPVCIDSLYVASIPEVLSPPAFMSFAGVYVLCFVLLDGALVSCTDIRRMLLGLRSVLCTACCIILASNIFFANEVFLKTYMQTKEATSVLTSVMTQVLASPDYDGTQQLAIIGTPKSIAYQMDEIDTSRFTGFVPEDPYDVYTRDLFLCYYLGYDIPTTTWQKDEAIALTDDFKAMPCYPAEGSIALLDGVMVVKLSDPAE